MPKALHDKLERIAQAKDLHGERKDAYVFGTMRKTRWKPKQERRTRRSPRRE